MTTQQIELFKKRYHGMNLTKITENEMTPFLKDGAHMRNTKYSDRPFGKLGKKSKKRQVDKTSMDSNERKTVQ